MSTIESQAVSYTKAEVGDPRRWLAPLAAGLATLPFATGFFVAQHKPFV